MGNPIKKIKGKIKGNQYYRKMAMEKRNVSEAASIDNFSEDDLLICDYVNSYYNEPVEEHTVLYEGFAGRGMVCGPSGVFNSFMRMEEFKDYTHIFSLENDTIKAECEEKYADFDNVKFVILKSAEYNHALATAKFLINNLSFPPYYIKRPEQIYINTWHGIPLKTLGYDIPGGEITGNNTLRNFVSADILTSPNPFMTEIFRNAFRMDGVSDGRIYECGMPRIDNIYHFEKEKVLEDLKAVGVDVDPDKKIILYAPTWRGDKYSNPDTSTELYFELMDEVRKHIDTDKYQVLTKPHQIVYKHMVDNGIDLDGQFVPASIDACEMLSIVDVLISDYSSIYFDFLVKDRPVFFFIPDLKDYVNSRGLYFGIDKLPGPIAENLETLGSYFDDIEATFAKSREVFDREKAWACPNDDGEAATRLIENVILKADGNVGYKATTPNEDGNYKKKVLIYSDKDFDKSVNQELKRVLRAVDDEKYDVTLSVTNEANKSVLNWIKSMPKKARVLRIVKSIPYTQSETKQYLNLKKMPYEELKKLPKDELDICRRIAKRERVRRFGLNDFDMVYSYFSFDHFDENMFRLYVEERKGKTRYMDDLNELILPEEYQLNADVLSIRAFGNKMHITMSLAKEDTFTKIEDVVLRYRGENPYDQKVKWSATEDAKKFIIKATVDFSKMELKEIYWDPFVLTDGGIAPVGVRFTSNKYKYKFYLTNMGFNIGKDRIIFPYYTAKGKLAFTYRGASKYDGYSTKVKDMVAMVWYKLFKKYYKSKNIWLVYEKFCTMAQDNGYYFFKYCMENLPAKEKKHIYYVIDKDSADYKNVEKYGKQVIQFMSVKHLVYALASSVYVGSDARSHLYVWRSKASAVRSRMTRVPIFFLQHGVTALKNVAKFFGAKGSSAMTHFTTTSQFEHEIAVNDLGYAEKDAPICGFTRWDVLEDKKTDDDKMILIMPTWRAWLEEAPDEVFVESDYFKNYSKLLQSKDLENLLEKYDARAVFYIHPKFAEYIGNFSLSEDSKRIKLIAFGEEPLNEIMMRCHMLITDYSSVCWDVYYQSKPVIFYQFDYEHYDMAHGSFIDMKTELFGRRTEDYEELLKLVEQAMKENYKLPEADALKLNYYFGYIDADNSKRTYEYLKKLYK